MATLLKVLVAAISAIILIPVALFLWGLFSISGAAKTSDIVDFVPTSFSAKASSKFFYSIGDELKYSDMISTDAPTLLRGKIKNHLVSPDSQLIAVVTNGMLQIVSGTGSIKHDVVQVDYFRRKPKPLGVKFFRDNYFQWSKDSKNLYLIKDEYYKSKGSQFFSTKGELWRYEISTAKLELVIKPFPAYNYFLGQNSAVYFSVPDSTGNLQLKYFNGNNERNIDRSNDGTLSVEHLLPDNRNSIFFSFSIHDYEAAILPRKGVHLVRTNGDHQELMIGTKTLMKLTLGQGFKGPYYGSELFRSILLPGDRYFLFNVNCGNHNGQLLIDTSTGNYMTLPKDTRVYLASNTNNFQEYQITGAAIESIPNRVIQAMKNDKTTSH